MLNQEHIAMNMFDSNLDTIATIVHISMSHANINIHVFSINYIFSDCIIIVSNLGLHYMF